MNKKIVPVDVTLLISELAMLLKSGFIVGWATCFCCPHFWAGGQQKHFAHPTQERF
jgi:hypothetical protein